MSGPPASMTDTPAAAARRVEAATGNGAEPIRVLKFLANLAVGGTERQFVNLATGLNRARFTVHVGCFRHYPEEMDIDPSVRIELFAIRKLYGTRALTQWLRLASYLRRERIQIVHSYNVYGNLFAVPAARLAGVPVVLASIRDNGECWTPRQRTFNKLACRLADRVIVNAQAIKNTLLEQGYDPARLVLIHNGIHCPPVDHTADAAFRREIDVPPHAPLVAVVARMTRQKGLEYFLQAAREIGARVPEARFLLIGDTTDAQYRREIRSFASRLGLDGRVRFTGLRLDVPRLLPSLAVSVLPSAISEGLSNSLLESMAAGVPVVATAVGGNPEIVIDGVTGLLVPPQDAPSLAAAISRLLRQPDLAASLGERGRQLVRERFGVQRMVSETAELYEDLLARRTPARQRARAPRESSRSST